LSTYSSLLKTLVYARLQKLSQVEDSPQSAVQLVREGFCDPVRIFVKNEPHNPDKVAQGRLRLIASVSLVDQMCERILYGRQNMLEIDKWIDIPSKPGMGLDDVSLKNLFQTWSMMSKPYEADMSGWDFSMQAWEMLWEADFRALLAGLSNTGFHRALRNRAKCEMTSLFMLSDGRLISQNVPGKRCSGSYNTSAGNSRVRVMVGHLIGARSIFAMGDDSVEDCSDTDVKRCTAKYRELGHVCKMYEPCKNGFEFCSTQIDSINGVVQGFPKNWAKSTFRLLFTTKDYAERLNQYAYEMRWHPQVDSLVEIGQRLLQLNASKVQHCASGVAQNLDMQKKIAKQKKKKNNNEHY